jgi:hypothetical protein
VRTLLYCVLRDSAPAAPVIRGLDGRAVAFVRAGGLAAAVSAIEPVELIPNVRRLVDYARVVEELFGRATVLPMRFGSSFADEADVARHIEHHARRLSEQLSELDGCAEMGIRVFLLEDEPSRAGSPGSPERQPPSRPAATGRAYLEELRRQLENDDPLRARREATLERCSRALGEMAVRHASELARGEAASFERLLASVQGGERTEAASRRPTLLASIHFLVKRELVSAFEERFRDLRPEQGTGLLISGPWPPYNFVARGREAHPP